MIDNNKFIRKYIIYSIYISILSFISIVLVEKYFSLSDYGDKFERNNPNNKFIMEI